MPLLETKGAGSAQGFGLSLGGEEAVYVEAVYVEDVFSTYLYTGTGATQTITNGIDLAGEGGLVWTKSRTEAGRSHALFDTARGINAFISSNLTSNFTISPSGDAIASFNANGYTLGADTGNWGVNNSANGNLASWTFRKQPKFFDVVTYTGNGSNRTIAHDLGSVPGCIIVKRTDTTGDWQVYHRANTANPETDYLVLNSTAATVDSNTRWNDTLPTATVFSLGTEATVNASGGTYVAYLFAHDAGGFGLTGLDNVISCGSFTTDGSGNATVTLGYEPQWVMIKRTDSSTGGDWAIYDTMRGWSQSNWVLLTANTSNSESNGTGSGADGIRPTATGFQSIASATPLYPSASYIYIAIRRGPMKVPTSGTQVYTPIARTGTNTNATISGVGFSPDLVLGMRRNVFPHNNFVDRLRGISPTASLRSTSTDAEQSLSTPNFLGVTSLTMDGVTVDGDQTWGYINFGTNDYVTHFFRRAPGFFDVVCYTGNGGSNTLSHNLGITPQIAIVKSRSAASSAGWFVNVPLAGTNNAGYLNLTNSFANSGAMSMNSTSFSYTAGFADLNASATTYVAYLFATVAGVSKVGSYTGNGSSQTINCGFTAGSRFVLIKRTDSTGDWYVWDSARGIVAGNDPHLSLNTTAAEVTTDDSVDTDSTGFVVNQVAATNVNVTSATYIFLAIA